MVLTEIPLTANRLLILALLIGLSLSGQAPAAEPGRMEFWGFSESAWQSLFGTAWTLYGNGEIDPNAGKRLASFMKTHGVPDDSYLILNSPGGSLLGGLDLGKIIREHHLRTDIGQQGNVQPTPLPGMIRYSTLSGICLSACSLAYLGGEFRFISKGSVYGVHRFAFTHADPANSSAAQVLSAMIVQYMQLMGVDPTLFTVMSSGASRSIVLLDAAELRNLNVVNNGYGPVSWSLESVPAGLYLKGEQNTVYGLDKLMILCDSANNLALAAMFDPQGRGNEIVDGHVAQSLFINEKLFPLNGYVIEQPRLINGLVSSLYRLDNKLLSKIRGASTLGIAMQAVYGAPTYLGFAAMPFSEGAKKLPGFLSVCHHK